MSDATQPGRSSRTTTLGILAIALVLVPATWFGVRRWLIDDTTEAVTTDEAVAEFREAAAGIATTTTTAPTTSVATPPPAVGMVTTTSPVTTTTQPVPDVELPLPGVYRYATTGFETVDALGGTRHDYPAETAITVTADDCGVRLRWDALRERREEWLLCVTDEGIEVQPESIQYHEFYGQGEEELVECARSIVVVPTTPAVGQGDPADQDCYRVDEAWLPVWQTIGPTTIDVEGEPVGVTHVRQQVVDEDDYWEHTTINWYLAPNGLPVLVTNVKESNSPSFVGDVVYTEEYELRLTSLAPIT